jgi:predicted esterase
LNRWTAALAAVLLLAATAGAKGEGRVEGRVRGPKKKGLRDAPVLVRVKAWPGGRFQWRSFETATNRRGRFELEDVVPPGTRYGVYAAVLAPGHTLTSRYVWSPDDSPVERIELDVLPAVKTRLRFRDADGTALAGLEVFPTLRAEPGRPRHIATPGKGGTGISKSEADGVATLRWFRPGEWVAADVRHPSGRWTRHHFVVPADGETIDIPEKAPPTPDLDLTAEGDGRKRYFLTGPKGGDVEPEAGYGLLLVLPGGTGGADFRPWVRERYGDWVDAGWVTAQLVAPVWDPGNEDRVVWPSEEATQAAMRFTTEAFVNAVVADVGKRVKIDPTRIVAAGWSSSGPALYRIMTLADTPVRGYFITMSVFLRNQLDSLGNVRGRAAFILHSPEDDRCNPFHAKVARKTLKKNGAEVAYAEYEGGHGWSNEATEAGRRALHWIDSALRSAR